MFQYIWQKLGDLIPKLFLVYLVIIISDVIALTTGYTFLQALLLTISTPFTIIGSIWLLHHCILPGLRRLTQISRSFCRNCIAYLRAKFMTTTTLYYYLQHTDNMPAYFIQYPNQALLERALKQLPPNMISIAFLQKLMALQNHYLGIRPELSKELFANIFGA